MYRIDTVTASVSLPTPAALGTEGFWTKGNPAGGVPATQMDQDWFNALQGNLIGIVDAAGLTHSKSDYTVLLRSIRMITAAHGQCRLQYVNSTTLQLIPCNGRNIFIAGSQYQIPAAGVSIAPTGLTPGTLYYVYLYNNAGTLTLELSTTGHATDTAAGNIGVEIKSGDNTRTLVGMCRPITGPAFQNSSAQRFVVSWFNRHDIAIAGASSQSGSTASLTPTFVEINSAGRAEFLTWADEAIVASIGGYMSNGTSGDGAVSYVAYDAVGNQISSTLAMTSSSAGALSGLANVGFISLAEGYHFLVAAGAAQTGGTASFVFQITGKIRG